MKSITIHDLEADLAKTIEDMAKAEGMSPGKVIKKLLRKALNNDDVEKSKRDISSFFGVWTNQEAESFRAANKIFEQIDEEMWK